MRALRVTLAVIAGFALNVGAGFGGIVIAWAVFGAEGAFEGETTVASTQWSVFGCIVAGISGALAGRVTSTVAKHSSRVAVIVLAGLVLAGGLGVAVVQFGADANPLPDGKSVGDLTFFEAGVLATNPGWYLLLVPWISALGMLWGGKVLPVLRN